LAGRPLQNHSQKVSGIALTASLPFINQNLGYFMKHLVPNGVNGSRPLTIITCVALLALSIVSACKKEEKGTTEKLMNKWAVVQINDTSYVPNSAPAINPYNGKVGDYMDFRRDGRMYSSIAGALDTAQYTYSEAKLKVYINNFQYNILYLTDNSMILWDPHYGSSTTTYVSHKVTLKR
jgi:hypothetical protein